jgi:transposase
MAQLARSKDMSRPVATLYMALELSWKNWKLAFSDGGTKERLVTVEAGEIATVAAAVRKAKEKYGLPARCRVVSCYEAGRDGFWIHRELEKLGLDNRVIDSSSIEVDRRSRRAKTDRLDARKLVALLVRHEERGDRMRVLHVPPPEVEDERRPHREHERLTREHTQHVNRIKSLLALYGIRAKVKREFALLVPVLRQPGGAPLPERLAAELVREAQRLELVRSQLRHLERERAQVIDAKRSHAARIAAQILLLRGLGEAAATTLSWELFGWRKFNNRREVGAAAGLVGTPWDSGEYAHEQGISKAGNRRVRALAVEVAWSWLRYQPQSRLSRWYVARFASGSGRARRIGIVALARKLLVDIWRFVEHGIIPDGAVLKPEL